MTQHTFDTMTNTNTSVCASPHAWMGRVRAWVACVRASVRPSVRPCVRASVRPCVRASVRPCVRTSVRPCVRASVRPCVRASVRPCVRASVRPCVRASVRPCVRASVRPCVRASVRPCVRASVRPCVRALRPCVRARCRCGCEKNQDIVVIFFSSQNLESCNDDRRYYPLDNYYTHFLLFENNSPAKALDTHENIPVLLTSMSRELFSLDVMSRGATSGSWNDTLLGYTTKLFWRIKFGQNYMPQNQELHRYMLGLMKIVAWFGSKRL